MNHKTERRGSVLIRVVDLGIEEIGAVCINLSDLPNLSDLLCKPLISKDATAIVRAGSEQGITHIILVDTDTEEENLEKTIAAIAEHTPGLRRAFEAVAP